MKKIMTLNEAIEHCQDIANTCDNKQCAAEHLQLVKWLEELKELRSCGYKKYEEALERAKKLKENPKAIFFEEKNIHISDYIFPELAESDDERIRKDIIWCLKHSGIKESNPINPHVTTTVKEAIAWLEKQGEKPQGKTALEAIKEEIVDNANKAEPIKLAESEDEEIRKRINHALHGDVLTMEETNKALAWLEKQANTDEGELTIKK